MTNFIWTTTDSGGVLDPDVTPPRNGTIVFALLSKPHLKVQILYDNECQNKSHVGTKDSGCERMALRVKAILIVNEIIFAACKQLTQ